jgi:hypothetical protein
VTSQNTLLKPILTIDGEEEFSLMSGKVNFPGNNAINTLTVEISDVEKEERSVLGRKVELYLNYDNNDGLPVFRGYITSYKPSGNKITLKASDPRIYLTSHMSPAIALTDKDNYDGYTLASFLYKYISEKINEDEVRIGLDMLRDTNPAIPLNGERKDKINPYDIIKKKLQSHVNTDDGLDASKKFSCIMIEGNDDSHISFVKRKSLEDNLPVFSYSLMDGIQDLSYTKRNPPNTAFIKGDNKDSATFKYGNRPRGIFNKDVSYDSSNVKMTGRAVLERAGMKSILADRDETAEITLTVTKGIHIGLESIVSIESGHYSHKDKYIVGNHIVVGKNISFNNNSCKIQLKLNRPQPLVSDYFQ